MKWILAHVERLGGFLVTPRASIARFLDEDEGRFGGILGWLLLLGCALSPAAVGRGLLVARVDLGAGFVMLAQALTRQLVAPLIGVVVAAAVLTLVARARGRVLGFDRAMDLCGFLLVPFLLLAAFGAILREVGLDFWFLPHHRLRGGGLVVFTIHVVVGYGASLGLLFLALVRAATPSGEHEVTASLSPELEHPS